MIFVKILNLKIMFNFIKKIFIILSLVLTGCSTLKSGLGLEKKKPDEFLIKKLDPITRPPTYELLPPDSKNKSKALETSKKNSSKDLRSLIENSVNKDGKDSTKDITNNTRVSDTNLEILKEMDSK